MLDDLLVRFVGEDIEECRWKTLQVLTSIVISKKKTKAMAIILYMQC